MREKKNNQVGLLNFSFIFVFLFRFLIPLLHHHYYHQIVTLLHHIVSLIPALSKLVYRLEKAVGVMSIKVLW